MSPYFLSGSNQFRSSRSNQDGGHAADYSRSKTHQAQRKGGNASDCTGGGYGYRPRAFGEVWGHRLDLTRIGNPAITSHECVRPEDLRPRLSIGCALDWNSFYRSGGARSELHRGALKRSSWPQNLQSCLAPSPPAAAVPAARLAHWPQRWRWWHRPAAAPAIAGGAAVTAAWRI